MLSLRWGLAVTGNSSAIATAVAVASWWGGQSGGKHITKTSWRSWKSVENVEIHNYSDGTLYFQKLRWDLSIVWMDWSGKNNMFVLRATPFLIYGVLKTSKRVEKHIHL